jgi:hypothetical protein
LPCEIVSSIGWLIGFRVVQAAGATVLLPTSPGSAGVIGTNFGSGSADYRTDDSLGLVLRTP